jgi:uncharacterized membrane protein YjjP (DUF1212 family)
VFEAKNQPFIIAIIVLVAGFVYLIVRGTADQTVIAIIAGGFGTVLSYFFANHISNGAATHAVDKAIADGNLEVKK